VRRAPCARDAHRASLIAHRGIDDRRSAMLVTQFLVLAALLFSLGTYGLLVRRNAVLVLLSVELMLAAVNINLVAFEAMLRTPEALGQIFTVFIIAVAAAEVGVGLAIILMVFRNRRSANLDELDLLKW
jgi:NADH:ubiquinone oxidoreductase subunit K